ncbi:hypothetical protein [Halobellus sp. EA9]|uniref:hypothetical protein n=1 Tax=Halobellus sp. EA9 TaxID=3421647 RepID=UPI003EBAF106
MRRRELLSFVPALLAGSLSGCLDGVGAGTPSTGTTPEPLPPSGYGSLSEFDAGDPFETRQIGEPSPAHHHRIVVWNDDSERRPVSLRLRDVSTDDVVFAFEPTFPAYGTLLVEVFRRADYVLAVDPPAADGRLLGIRRDFVDCNDSATHVAVRPDSSVRARVVSTAVACDVGTATVEGSDSGSRTGSTSAPAEPSGTPTPTPR